MGYALPITVHMTDMTCGRCGINYSVPEKWRASKQRTGEDGHCPNGHSWAYRETEAMRFKRLLQEEEQRHKRTLERTNAAEAARAQAESELQRHKKRAKHGVCPCCKRTFKQLASHMKTKHPTYTA